MHTLKSPGDLNSKFLVNFSGYGDITIGLYNNCVSFGSYSVEVSDIQVGILEILLDENGITKTEIAEELEKSIDIIQKQLDSLERRLIQNISDPVFKDLIISYLNGKISSDTNAKNVTDTLDGISDQVVNIQNPDSLGEGDVIESISRNEINLLAGNVIRFRESNIRFSDLEYQLLDKLLSSDSGATIPQGRKKIYISKGNHKSQVNNPDFFDAGIADEINRKIGRFGIGDIISFNTFYKNFRLINIS